MRFFAVVLTAATFLAAGLVACGGESENSVAPQTPADVKPEQIDADPLALLPGSAIAVTNVDARAFYASATLGPQLARITERLLPIGEEAGFRPSRDVDRIVLGSYAMQGVDVAAVVTGRFDEQKLDDMAKKNTPAKGGGQIVESTYAGRTLFTLNNIGMCVLTSHTLLAGTETGIRRALDRIKEGRVKRSIPEWMITTIETQGAEGAVAADFAAQNLANLSAGPLRLDWLKGLQKVRVIGNFKEPGMELAGSLTYDTAEGAQTGKRGIESAHNLATMASAFSGLVPKIQGLDVQVADTSVQWKFSVDDQSMRTLLKAVEQYAL
ncbi:hypothetical protein LVJ94_22995 [Pendulispora rubella]|uniref:Secreted protein n=1 Tax=Pendulispora rubella TaxID=2741070 RepID=A0ABZ2LH67_9BACT